jgi:uncharacterized membrane protein
MKIKLYALREQLSGSFWFLPTVMVGIAIILALVMTQIDRYQMALQTANPLLSWIYSGSADGARSLLSTIAGSMITVAGITFSITITTLSLVSSQLGPRLLNNFMRDRGNQVSLGTFVATFTYCLFVLRTIRSTDEITFVPHFSVTLAIALAVISLEVLIYFFHHVSTMIQAQNVIANIGSELEASIERLFSNQSGKSHYEYELRREDDIPADFDENTNLVTVPASGYLQTINYEALLQVARESDLLLRLFYRPGDFIANRSEIIAFYPKQELSESVEKNIQNAFTLGTGRLRVQDVDFSIDQLVEIAVRALSPGINDPFTAIACLDQFSTTLAALAEHTIPSGYYYDTDGHLRVISDVVTFNGIVNAAFNQIRQHGRSDIAVTIRLLEVIAIILARTQSDKHQQALVQQAEMIKRASDEVIFEENDRRDITERYDIILRILKGEKTGADS